MKLSFGWCHPGLQPSDMVRHHFMSTLGWQETSEQGKGAEQESYVEEIVLDEAGG